MRRGGRGKLIVSASAPRSNYGEDLNAGWLNFLTRLNVDLSTQDATQCLALRPPSNPRASCMHTHNGLHSNCITCVLCTRVRFATRHGWKSRKKRKKKGGGGGGEEGTHSARGPHETICHYTCMSARCGVQSGSVAHHFSSEHALTITYTHWEM